MAVHLSLTLVTLGLGTLWWSSFGANTAFMLCIFTASAWSGATFYFDVFAHRYVSSVGIKRRHRGSATPPHSQQSGPATVSTAGTLRRR